MSGNTQSERLLEWMQRGKTINCLQAFDRLGITQLATRIFELKNNGHKVRKKPFKVTNKFGEPLTITNYYMK